MSYMPNYRWSGSKKKNTMRWSKYPLDVVFLTSKVGFETQTLDFCANMLFRGATSWSAIAFSFGRTFGNLEGTDVHYGFRKMLSLAVTYYLAAREFESIGMSDTINVEEDLSHAQVQRYSAYLHNTVYPPENPAIVREVVGDGNAKVVMKCGQAMGRGVGRPRKNNEGQVRSRSHGWFMLVEPRLMRILSLEPMLSPENNAIKNITLKKIIGQYPNLDCFIHDRNCSIHDRNCSFQNQALQFEELQQLKYFPIDRFHAKTHKKGCRNNPLTVSRLGRRIRKVNTSAAEQTFSWFKKYSITIGEMPKGKHMFLVLLFARWHNTFNKDMDYWKVRKGQRYSKKASRAYGC